MSETPLVPLKEYAERKRLPYVHLRRLSAQGLFPVVRCGRKLYVDPEMAAAWIRGGGAALPGGWRRVPKDGGAAS